MIGLLHAFPHVVPRKQPFGVRGDAVLRGKVGATRRRAGGCGPVAGGGRALSRCGAFGGFCHTVDPEGRPHTTPVDAVWVDDRLYFGGSPQTRRNRNLAANPAVAVHLEDAMDVAIVQGDAHELRVVDPALGVRLAEASKKKYGFSPKPEEFGKGGTFVLRPRVAFAWTKFPKDATRWRFE